jgi:hypothetical protein
LVLKGELEGVRCKNDIFRVREIVVKLIVIGEMVEGFAVFDKLVGHILILNFPCLGILDKDGKEVLSRLDP